MKQTNTIHIVLVVISNTKLHVLEHHTINKVLEDEDQTQH